MLKNSRKNLQSKIAKLYRFQDLIIFHRDTEKYELNLVSSSFN